MHALFSQKSDQKNDWRVRGTRGTLHPVFWTERPTSMHCRIHRLLLILTLGLLTAAASGCRNATNSPVPYTLPTDVDAALTAGSISIWNMYRRHNVVRCYIAVDTQAGTQAWHIASVSARSVDALMERLDAGKVPYTYVIKE